MMGKKGLKLSKSQFPRLLENVLYEGKVYVPAFKDEDALVVQGLHEPIVSEELFSKVQRLLKSNRKSRKVYERLNDETPLRAMLTCCRCGGKLTSSASKGRTQYYNYYHCRGKCQERIPAERAHEALLNYFDNVAVKPEVAKLYLEVMGSVFKNNESDRQQQVNKYKENLNHAENKLASLEEKFILNEIERDSYAFMKPKFKEEVQVAKSKIDELQGTETNHTKYLKSGVYLIQNLSLYYQKATLNHKQKLIGSIFPENLIIENGECRTTKENTVILSLKGFDKDFKKGMAEKFSAIPVG